MAQASMAYSLLLLLLLYITDKCCWTSSSRGPDYANSSVLWPPQSDRKTGV